MSSRHLAPKSRASSSSHKKIPSTRLNQKRRMASAARNRPQGGSKKPQRSLADLDSLPFSQAPFEMNSLSSPYNHAIPSAPDSETFTPNHPQNLQTPQTDFSTSQMQTPKPSPSSNTTSTTTTESQDPQNSLGLGQETEIDPGLAEILASTKPVYDQHNTSPPQKTHPHSPPSHSTMAKRAFFIEPPDPTVISRAVHDSDQVGERARQSIVQYFRNVSRQSDLSKPSIPVPYLLPIGESSPTTYPIPEYLMHTLYHLSGTTVANYGIGMAAPQYGVNHRMFVIRSEVFGVASPITNIPYILETSERTHCMVPPRVMQRTYQKPPKYETMALSWDNPNPEFDFTSKPPLNISMSTVDYHDMVQMDDPYLASRPDIIQYHLQKKLAMPTKDAKQLNLCDDRILTQSFTADSSSPHPYTSSKSFTLEMDSHRIFPNNSFINDYRGYSIPLAELERDTFIPLLQAFKQQLPTTAVLNPRVTAVRYEYFSMREGCFSFPHWHALMSRPIACDVEFETLEVDQAKVPQVISRGTQGSIFLSGSLALPSGSQIQYCPKASESGLDPQFISPTITRQLEISRLLPRPEQVKLVTRKLTMRDIASKVFLHEYDHLDGLQFFDRTSGKYLNWQGSARQTKLVPNARFEYPVDIAGSYF